MKKSHFAALERERGGEAAGRLAFFSPCAIAGHEIQRLFLCP